MPRRKPRLLDLYSGAGGAARGYQLAGFHVTGIDHRPQPRYPGEAFVQADALEFLAAHGGDFDAIHASPPCQAYTRASFTDGNRAGHPDLLAPTRRALLDLAVPWVIENVPGAPLQPPAVMLCGLMFGLGVFRHRWFESSEFLLLPPHPSHRGKVIGKDGMCCVVGHGGGVSRRMRDQVLRHRDGAGGQQTKADWEKAMGIGWMTRNEMSQALPPAFTAYLGVQLRRFLEATDGT